MVLGGFWSFLVLVPVETTVASILISKKHDPSISGIPECYEIHIWIPIAIGLHSGLRISSLWWDVRIDDQTVITRSVWCSTWEIYFSSPEKMERQRIVLNYAFWHSFPKPRLLIHFINLKTGVIPWRARAGRQKATKVLEPREHGTGSGRLWPPRPPPPLSSCMAPLRVDQRMGRHKWHKVVEYWKVLHILSSIQDRGIYKSSQGL